jgi:hypothetical protein
VAAIATGLLLGLAGGRGRAQQAEDATADAASLSARARYNAGTKAFADRRFVEAALDFEAAAAEKPSPVALYTAALSWEQADVPDRAADDYARALAPAAASALGPDKVAFARERLVALEGVLGAVTVVGPMGWRVQLDANTEVPVPATLHGSAGVHTLTARAPGKPIRRQPVLVERGAQSSLDLGVSPPSERRTPEGSGLERTAQGDDATGAGRAPPAATPAALPPTPERRDWQRPAGFAALGAGGALLLAGVVLGSEALGARDAYRGAPTRDGFDHATELQTWTNVAFVAGGVVAATGVVLLVWPPPRAQPGSRALGLVVEGVF